MRWEVGRNLQVSIPQELSARLDRLINAKAKKMKPGERISLSRLVSLVITEALDAMEGKDDPR